VGPPRTTSSVTANPGNAGNEQARTAALGRSADSYRGDLADGQPCGWIEPEREALRRQAADALTGPARLREPDDPEAALVVLARTLRRDPYAEEIYRQVMRLQAQAGRPDAARRTYRLLETRPADLDAEPDQTPAACPDRQAGRSGRGARMTD